MFSTEIPKGSSIFNVSDMRWEVEVTTRRYHLVRKLYGEFTYTVKKTYTKL